MAYTPTPWVNNTTPAINATNLNKIENGISEAHDKFSDIISGSTPTYSGYTVNPTDGAKITDGNTTTACTTGSANIAAYDMAYMEWNLGQVERVLVGGYGSCALGVGAWYICVEGYLNGAWHDTNAVASSITSNYSKPFIALMFPAERIRLGITSNANVTIAPNITELNVWKI